MDPSSVDARVRLAAFDFLARQTAIIDEVLPRTLLAQGFLFEGIRVPPIGPQGIFAVGPSFTLPIFNTGRTGAGVDSAEARAQIALDQYRLTVVQAFREVSDALVEYQKRKEFRVQQEALHVAARDTSRLANMRYTGGVSSYLEVLDSERQLFDAELGVVRSYRDELIGIVRLYKALGGGWQEQESAVRTTP